MCDWVSVALRTCVACLRDFRIVLSVEVWLGVEVWKCGNVTGPLLCGSVEVWLGPSSAKQSNGGRGGRREEDKGRQRQKKRGRRRGNLNCDQSGRDAARGWPVDQFDWLGRWHQISSSLYVPPFGKRDQLIRGTRWIAYPLNEFCGAFCSNYSFHPSQIRVWSIWITFKFIFTKTFLKAALCMSKV